MARAVGYMRVSTEGQVGEDRLGFAAQREAIAQYAQAQGFEVVAWYSDEGLSGATLERPMLQALLDQAQGSLFQAVIVAKMDRIARDLMAQLWIEKELLKRNVELVSAGEPFRGQDPANVLFRQVIGAFAQFETARIAERMTSGRRQKAALGGYAGGGAPTGYRVRRGGKTLELDPAGVELVTRTFALRELHADWTLQEIANRLNEEAFSGPRGGRMFPMQVKRILDRRAFYGGLYEYSGVQALGQHAAILE